VMSPGTTVIGTVSQLHRDVEIEAGKTYLFLVAIGASAPGHIYRSVGFEVDGTYTGYTHTINSSVVNEKSGDPKIFFGRHLFDTIGQYRQQDLYGVYIGPYEEAKTVRLRFGHANSASPFGRVWTLVSNPASISASYVGLHEVVDDTCVPALVGTAGAAVTDSNLTYGRGFGLWGVKQGIAAGASEYFGAAVNFAGYMRGSKASPFQTDIRDLKWDPRAWQASSATQFRRLKDNNYEWSIGSSGEVHGKAWTHPRMALPGAGHDKLYFEVTCTTLDGGSTTADRPMVYLNSSLAVFAGHNTPETALPSSTSATLRSGYSAQGKVTEGTTTTTGLSTWGLNDVVGVALDFSANTADWYLNGTLVRSSTLPTGMKDHPVAAELVFGDLSSTAAIPAFSINFTGPFSSKPTGFEAWDWPNEVL
jgi:hypothetical protein